MTTSLALYEQICYNISVRNDPKQLTMSGFILSQHPCGAGYPCFAVIPTSSPLGVAGRSEQTNPLTTGLLYFLPKK